MLEGCLARTRVAGRLKKVPKVGSWHICLHNHLTGINLIMLGDEARSV